MVPPLHVPVLHSLIRIQLLVKILFAPILTLLAPLIDRKQFMYRPGFAPQETYLDSFEKYDEHDPLVNNYIFLGNLKRLAVMMLEFKKLLPNITQPTLILQGTGDTILNYIGAQEVFDTIKSTRKRLKFYMHANHSLFMDKHSQAIYDDIFNFAEKERSKQLTT
jgi:esterase/lipase